MIVRSEKLKEDCVYSPPTPLRDGSLAEKRVPQRMHPTGSVFRRPQPSMAEPEDSYPSRTSSVSQSSADIPRAVAADGHSKRSTLCCTTIQSS